MMFYTDNPIRDFDRYDAYLYAESLKRPSCSVCGCSITGFVYEIDGEIMDEECFNAYVRENIAVSVPEHDDTMYKVDGMIMTDMEFFAFVRENVIKEVA